MNTTIVALVLLSLLTGPIDRRAADGGSRSDVGGGVLAESPLSAKAISGEPRAHATSALPGRGAPRGRKPLTPAAAEVVVTRVRPSANGPATPRTTVSAPVDAALLAETAASTRTEPVSVSGLMTACSAWGRAWCSGSECARVGDESRRPAGTRDRACGGPAEEDTATEATPDAEASCYCGTTRVASW